MKKSLKIIAIGIGVWFVVSVIVAATNNNDSVKPDYNDNSTWNTYQTVFIKSCEGSSSDNQTLTQTQVSNYCQCAWDDLNTNNSHERIIEIAKEYNSTGRMPQEMSSAIVNCVGEIQ